MDLEKQLCWSFVAIATEIWLLLLILLFYLNIKFKELKKAIYDKNRRVK